MSLCSCYIYHSGTCASRAVTVPGAKANSRDASAKASMSEHNRQSRAGQHSAVNAAKQNGAEQNSTARSTWQSRTELRWNQH